MQGPTKARSHPFLVRGLPLTFLAVAASIAVVTVVREWSDVSHAVEQVSVLSIVVSFVACLVGLIAAFRAWAALVADTGERLTWRQALRIYGVGQTGKYVPGGVWSIAMQAQMVREYGGSRARIASASLVILVLAIAVALGMGSILIPFSGSAARSHFWFTPLLAVGAVVAISPAVLNRLSSLAGRLLRREQVMPTYSRRGVARAAAWLVLAHLVFGFQVWVIAREFGADGIGGFALATATYCLAVALGLLFVPAPAGAGVREFVFVVVLSATMSTGAALVVALVSRLVSVAADLVLAMSQVVSKPHPDRHPVFVTRRFPPSVGGMETLAAGVWRSLQAARPDAILIAHGGSNLALLWWLPRAWIRVGWLVATRRVEVVVVGDAPTYAIFEPLLLLSRVRRAPMVLGLDVSYPHPLYRASVLPALKRAPQVIAISEATREATIRAGVRAERVVVVRLGVQPGQCSDAERTAASRALRERLGLSTDVRLLLTLGRLVERKGVRWFVDNVLPELPADVHYVVAGSGPEDAAIRAAGEASGTSPRLTLLGAVEEDTKEQVLRAADLFVQPNIPVAGDMEGFGLVTVEAATRGTVVVASALEGLIDAVLDGETGLLLPPGDAEAWVATLTDLLEHDDRRQELGRRFAEAARLRYSEDQMGRQICQALGIESEARETVDRDR